MSEKYELSTSCNIQVNEGATANFVYLAQCYCDQDGYYGPSGDGRKALTRLLADANYGAAIREFATAAEPIVRVVKGAAPGFAIGSVRIGGWAAAEAARHALALLPIAEPASPTLTEQRLAKAIEEVKALSAADKAEPASPTLAEQGEEIKLNLGNLNNASTYMTQDRLERLLSMVDAIVAGGKK